MPRSMLRALLSIDRFSARKGGMSNRHRRSLGTARSDNLGIELLCKRLDDAGSQAGFRLRKNPIGFANSVVGNRKFPIGPGYVIRNGNLSILRVIVEGVF